MLRSDWYAVVILYACEERNVSFPFPWSTCTLSCVCCWPNILHVDPCVESNVKFSLEGYLTCANNLRELSQKISNLGVNFQNVRNSTGLQIYCYLSCVSADRFYTIPLCLMDDLLDTSLHSNVNVYKHPQQVASHVVLQHLYTCSHWQIDQTLHHDEMESKVQNTLLRMPT